MITKAVFIDYMGTLVQDESEYSRTVIARCFRKSNAKNPGEVASWWFRRHDELLEECIRTGYRSESEIVLELFCMAMEQFDFSDDPYELRAILTRHWTESPVYDDAKAFLINCPCPVYVVSNNDTCYLQDGIRRLTAAVAGSVSSEMVQAYKPDPRIFAEALRISGCSPEEVIHIGDSLRSDGLGARNAGIEPLILDRDGRCGGSGFQTVRSLTEALERI